MPADVRWIDQGNDPEAERAAGLNAAPAAFPGGALPEPIRSLTHDLRAPLAALQSCLNLVLSGAAGDLTPDQRHFLGLGRRNIDRLDRMVEEMLTAAREEAGPQPDKWSEVDLGPILKETVGLHRLTAARRGLVLDDDGLPADFPARVDADLVVRLLDNMLGNAVKFTGCAGRVRVWLEAAGDTPPGLAGRLARRWDLPLATFDLIVQDNGPGLAATLRDGPGGSSPAGFGLGLSITRRLVASHGGHVRLTSGPEQGTTVRLHLPRDPGSRNILLAAHRLEGALARAAEHGAAPVIGVLDLRAVTAGGAAPPGAAEEFFGPEMPGAPDRWQPAPGLWVCAVGDPVNWNRRWALYAARRGGGLEAVGWEFLAPGGGEDPTAAAPFGKRSETMVNPAARGPKTW